EPRFDAAVVFPNSLRSALEVWVARIPRRVGYRGHRRSLLLNQIPREPRKARPPEHQAWRYLRLAEQLGAGVDTLSVGEPIALRANATSRLDEQPSQPAGNGKTRLGLCPGAEYGPA